MSVMVNIGLDWVLYTQNIDYFRRNFLFSENKKQNRYVADLTKGSFGHFSSFYVSKILKTSKISVFCMFLQESQIAFNM